MNQGDNQHSKYQTTIIEICGEVLASKRDWNDTEYLEEAWFSKYPEGFPVKAAFELVLMNNAPKEAVIGITSAGQLLKVFIEARLNRFVWRPEDFTILSDEESQEIHYSDWPSPGEKIPRIPGTEGAADSIDGMTSAIAKARVDKPIVTYRGLLTNGDLDNSFQSRLKPGRVIKDKAFLSTTLNEENLKWLKDVLLVPIYTPAGVPALYLPSVTPSFKEEMELVLQRGTNLKILDAKQTDADHTQLQLAVLPGR